MTGRGAIDMARAITGCSFKSAVQQLNEPAPAFILEDDDEPKTGPTARQARFSAGQRALGRYKFTVWATRPEATRLERVLNGLRAGGLRGFLGRWLLRPFLGGS